MTAVLGEVPRVRLPESGLGVEVRGQCGARLVEASGAVEEVAVTRGPNAAGGGTNGTDMSWWNLKRESYRTHQEQVQWQNIPESGLR